MSFDPFWDKRLFYYYAFYILRKFFVFSLD